MRVRTNLLIGEAEQYVKPAPLPFKDDGLSLVWGGVFVETPDSRVAIADGDWIIKTTKGAFIVLSNSAFNALFEGVKSKSEIQSNADHYVN